jgi:Asp-tRNA(Asn)/Glu-tRNA(Gln) amidotransferase B subunit
MFIARELTDRNAELVVRHMVKDQASPDIVISKHGIPRMIIEVKANDRVTVKGKKIPVGKVLEQVLGANAKAVQDYRSGEKKALHFLVGLVMKETRGQLDAIDVRKLILRLLK